MYSTVIQQLHFFFKKKEIAVNISIYFDGHFVPLRLKVKMTFSYSQVFLLRGL